MIPNPSPEEARRPKPVGPQQTLGVLRGKLIDGRGKPIAEQRICIICTMDDKGTINLLGSTDPDGSFEISDIPAAAKWEAFISTGYGAEGVRSSKMVLPESKELEVVVSFDGKHMNVVPRTKFQTPKDIGN